MRTLTRSLLLCLTLLALGLTLSLSVNAQVTPAPSLLNFQGRLAKPDGTPVADGTYSLRFSLWDAATGGTEKWNQTINPITVRNGTFAVLLSGFANTTFAGNLWVEIQIGTDAPLTPRQQLVSVAYALKANSVPDGSIGAAQIADGSITAAKLASGANTPSGNAGGDLTGTYPNPLLATLASSLTKVSGGVLTSDGTNLGIGDNRFLALAPNEQFSYDSKQMAQYGLGWFRDTWQTGGPTLWLSGYGGMKFFTSGTLRMAVTRGGNFGIGTDAPSRKLTVQSAASNDGIQVIAGSGAPPSYTLADTGGDKLNIGLALNVGQFSTSVSPGDVVIRTGTNRLHIQNGSGAAAMTFNGNNVGIGTTTPGVKLDVSGEIRGTVVTVLGGSDVAEPYNVAPAGAVKAIPGYVVAIDSDKVGQMRVVSRAYDKTVAGIVSGANGINPGITLRQKGTIADGELPIASIGRVWCWCDADASGPIVAGDLLTTSDTPGHAMKAVDKEQRDGAVIGKAMSSLKSGKGLVLVLVSLK